MTFTNTAIVNKIAFLKDKNSDFLWKVLPLLKAHKVFRGDILYAQQDTADEIFFVIEGSFTVYFDLSGMIDLPPGTIDYDTQAFNVPYSIYTEGSYFGDSDCLVDLLLPVQNKNFRDSTAEATDNSEVMKVYK
jgi:CRP-like cAMP-binding protein